MMTITRSNMPVFNDSQNIPPVVPEGDYVFCVVGFECGISSGGKTAGSDKYDVELEIEPSGKRVTEFLIDHPSCSWKIDTFLKSCGIQLAKGEAFEFREDIASATGVRWVNPLGLRGHCRLYVEEYTPKGGTEKRKANKVAVFYTDRPKLEPRAISEADVPF